MEGLFGSCLEVLRAKETTGGKVPSRRQQGQQRDEGGCSEGSQRQRGMGPDRAGGEGGQGVGGGEGVGVGASVRTST